MKVTAILLALGAAILATPAFASHHPTQAANEIIDEAAVPAYPIETVAPLRRGWYHHRHSSVDALRRSRSRRTSVPRHLVNRPRPAEEAHTSAHSSPAVSARLEGPKIAPGPSASDVGLAQAAMLGRILDLPGPYEDGLTTSPPIIVRQRPYHFEGKLTIADASFDFGTGGYGRGSVPYGDWPIDDSEGDWGKRHKALGLNGDEIYDRQLGRDREGIEMHGAYHLASAGCVAIENWDKARAKILAMVNQFGHAFLHIWPGMATVTPERSTGRAIVVLTERERFAENEPVRHHHHFASRHRHRRYAAR